MTTAFRPPLRPASLLGLWTIVQATLAMLSVQPAKAQGPGAAPATAFDPAAIEFFEREVRPILAARCFECHGDKKQEAGLRLDSRDAVLQGSDNGPAIVPGDPEQSRLATAIGYADANLQMPPEGRLPDKELAALIEWVRQGAVWPADRPEGAGRQDHWKRHWAFRPVADPLPPDLPDDAWSQTPLDKFVLAKLRERTLTPSLPADRRTLIRRATYDLTGLPPTAAEIDAFAGDASPNAWSDVVDRLLASSRYGERWARHWLDVARYADDKGYHFFGGNDFYGYTYRDWVVQALNDDLPYDRFILEQLAADCLVTPEDTRSLAAMGFLTIGRRFLEDIHDIIDDRIDVVSRGLLGLTATCARCHDHKFDPIPMSEYYSLYGVFAGSREQTRTLLREADLNEDQRAYERDLAAVEGAVEAYIDRRLAELTHEFRTRVGDYLLAGRDAQSSPPTDRFMYVEEPGQMSQMVIGRWRALLDRTQRGHHPALAAWHAFGSLPASDFAAQAPAIAARVAANADADRSLNPHVAALFAGAPPTTLAEVAQRYGQLFSSVEQEWQELASRAAQAGQPEPRELPDPRREELRWLLYGPVAPPDVPRADTEMLVGRKGQAEVAELRKKVAEFKAARPPLLPRATVLVESPALYRFNPRIFMRGKPTNIGPETPRQFFRLAAGENRQPFPNASGRLDLARAIASRDNPLTARVFVNRLWMHHFGSPLVASTSDFGLRSDPPSHPELLDWLAMRFMEEGWSMKRLHKRIMMSSAYRQASADRPDCSRVDPDNRWLWRMNRRRLELESMRDSLLAASGQLDGTVGGPAVDLSRRPFSRRRTIYGFVDRQNLPGMFRAFDFANPDSHSPRRFQTTVPQQALFLMNSPFVIEQAQGTATRPDIAQQADADGRIAALYRALYGRAPCTEELALGRQFVTATDEAPPLSPWQYGYGGFDAATQRTTSFSPLPHWNGTAWQGGPQLPDATLGWLTLTATGGHPEAAPNRLAIRRWVSPAAGEASITGKLQHEVPEGDGVQGRIVSSRAGLLGAWTVQHAKANTDVEHVPVQVGDTLDFVVDCRGGIQSDQHLWAPVIRLQAPAGSPQNPAPQEWDANAQFAGRELTSWEAYVQALLLANEFVFVD